MICTATQDERCQPRGGPGAGRITTTRRAGLLDDARDGSTDPGAHPALYRRNWWLPLRAGHQHHPGSRGDNTAIIPFRCRTIVLPGTADYPNGLQVWGVPAYQHRAAPGQRPGTVTLVRCAHRLRGAARTQSACVHQPPDPAAAVHRRGPTFHQTDFVTGMPRGMASSFDLKAIPGTCSTTAINQSRSSTGKRLFVDTAWIWVWCRRADLRRDRTPVEDRAVADCRPGDLVELDQPSANDRGRRRLDQRSLPSGCRLRVLVADQAR